jgi:hypothetical protein
MYSSELDWADSDKGRVFPGSSIKSQNKIKEGKTKKTVVVD